MDQRAAQPELLPHTPREFAGRPVGEGREPGRAEQLADAPVALLRPLAEEAAEELHVLEDRERCVEVFPQALRHVGHAREHGRAEPLVRHVPAHYLDPSRLDRPGARYQRKQAGFAHAVGSDEADHAAGRKIEGDFP